MLAKKCFSESSTQLFIFLTWIIYLKGTLSCSLSASVASVPSQLTNIDFFPPSLPGHSDQ